MKAVGWVGMRLNNHGLGRRYAPRKSLKLAFWYHKIGEELVKSLFRFSVFAP